MGNLKGLVNKVETEDLLFDAIYGIFSCIEYKNSTENNVTNSYYFDENAAHSCYENLVYETEADKTVKNYRIVLYYPEIQFNGKLASGPSKKSTIMERNTFVSRSEGEAILAISLDRIRATRVKRIKCILEKTESGTFIIIENFRIKSTALYDGLPMAVISKSKLDRLVSIASGDQNEITIAGIIQENVMCCTETINIMYEHLDEISTVIQSHDDLRNAPSECKDMIVDGKGYHLHPLLRTMGDYFIIRDAALQRWRYGKLSATISLTKKGREKR